MKSFFMRRPHAGVMDRRQCIGMDQFIESLLRWSEH